VTSLHPRVIVALSYGKGKRNGIAESAVKSGKTPPFDKLRAGFLAQTTLEKWGTLAGLRFTVC
jgi:hypothetical protein